MRDDFPPIYWINLDRSPARRARMEARFASRDLANVRVPAVDGDAPGLSDHVIATNVPPRVAAASASHLRAISRAYDDGCAHAIVLEDDMTFELLDAWPEGLATLRAELPERYGVVRLCVAETPRRLDALYKKRGVLVPVTHLYWCAGAYLISRAGMETLLQRFVRGDAFDLGGFAEEQDPEHVVIGSLRATAFDARVPLFVYEGSDSDIHPDHLPRYRRARDFILAAHPSLVAGTYRSRFSLAAGVRDAASLAAYVPRWASDHLEDRLGVPGNRDDAADARYMSQHALALACDHNGGPGYVFWGIEGRPWLLDMSTYADIQPGALVWIRIEDLARFNREVLPSIREPFVLITGESDYCVPRDFSAPSREIAESGKLLRWFTTNFDRSAHAELCSPLPLGMNYRKKHDLHWVSGGLLRRERYAIRRQEERWEAAAARAWPLKERLPLAFGDFWLNDSSRSRRYGESRGDIHHLLRDNPCCVFPRQIVEHDALLAEYGRHAVVVSPHGGGLDCYRTWEALFMGCVVVVKRSPLDSLYEGLPVVIVDDWREIDTQNIARWVDRFADGFDRRLLTLEHWLSQIRVVVSGASVPESGAA